MPNKKLANYVKRQNEQLPEYKFGLIHVIIKDQIQNDVDVNFVFNKINNLIPRINNLLNLCEGFFVRTSFSLFKFKKKNIVKLSIIKIGFEIRHK